MHFPKEVAVTFADAADLGRLVPHDAPHQGVVIEPARHRPVVERIRPDRQGAGDARCRQRRRDRAAIGNVQEPHTSYVTPSLWTMRPSTIVSADRICRIWLSGIVK